MPKKQEDFLYEYVIVFGTQEIAAYYSDANPPEMGSLLDPWEFVPEEEKAAGSIRHKGPFRVADVNQQPKKTDSKKEDISLQTFVYIRVATA
jgi:hypothetical protein